MAERTTPTAAASRPRGTNGRPVALPPRPPLEPKTRISGWGRLHVDACVVESEDLERATESAILTRGLGRSYGDSSLPPADLPSVVASPLADRIRWFDRTTGRLRVEAGCSLFELNRLFLRRRWFTPVSPGTQFVTVGGMVAADIHGKNHHVDGCFGNFVHALRLRVADGRIVECSRDFEPELFRATLGGMGLTGHILEVELSLRRIPSPWIAYESERVPNIGAFLVALKRAAFTWPYTVGWIDCLSRGARLGRGILQRGRWAEPGEAPRHPPARKARISVPFQLPEWVLGRWSVRLFNELYYRRHTARLRRTILHPEEFFYPLDTVLHWNRLYGSRGFTQYQAVIPEEAGPEAVHAFLALLAERGGASFLCVIKDCGAEGPGLLTFPRRGTSIALDIPIRDGTPQLVGALNEKVMQLGGRIYLAKDALSRAEHFRAMESRLPAFQAVRDRWDPTRRIRSAQSVRLLGDPEGRTT